MSKSGQPAAKADNGGQRVPKSDTKSAGSSSSAAADKAPKKDAPVKKEAGKKNGG